MALKITVYAQRWQESTTTDILLLASMAGYH